MIVLILAAGAGHVRLARARARRAAWIVAANGGLRLARRAGLRVNAFVGDGDSLGRRERARLARAPFPVAWHPRDKDETDLELALELALAQKPRAIEVVGGWGGRADQTLSNLFLLERAVRQGVKASLWTARERLLVLRPGAHVLAGARPGQRVSLVPLSARVEGLRTWGLRFPLEEEPLERAAGRGISNEVIAPPVEVRFARGTLVVVQALARGCRLERVP